MTEKQYDKVLQEVTHEIYRGIRGIRLLTIEEQVAYLKRIAKDISDWATDIEDDITEDKMLNGMLNGR